MSVVTRLARRAIKVTGRDILRLGSGQNYLITRGRVAPDDRQRLLNAYLLRDHLGRLLSGLNINCVLDVGANTGQYARKLRAAGYHGHLVSFEPIPELAEQLRADAADDPRWHIHNCALGSRDDTVDFHVTELTDFSSILNPNEYCAERFGDQGTVARTISVPLRRLDGLIPELVATIDDPRLYLKLDTQGHDLEAFAGLGSQRDRILAMQSEMSMIPIYDGMPHMTEALLEYEAAGFAVAGMYPVNTDDRTGCVIEFDCLLVRSTA